jgi:hypothetical protein
MSFQHAENQVFKLLIFEGSVYVNNNRHAISNIAQRKAEFNQFKDYVRLIEAAEANPEITEEDRSKNLKF